MARGDKTRELGKQLDEIHTKLCGAREELIEKLDELDGILHPKVIESMTSDLNGLDAIFDEIVSTYTDLDNVADELDSDESDDESTKRELEKELATAEEKIEELESENDDLSDKED